MKTALLWATDVSGQPYGPISKLDFLRLQIGPIGCPETAV
jgi:hypothetical protein